MGLKLRSRVGYGAMHLSTEGRPAEKAGMRVLDAAAEAGAAVIDTADSYCIGADDFGHNEALVGRWLRKRGRRDVVVATKGGHTRDHAGGWGVDGRPEYLVAACEASLRRLGVDAIDLYLLHRPDPRVPFEDSVAALGDLVAAGKARHVGISNVSRDQIETARAIVEIAAVQNELSPRFRASISEAQYCCERSIPFLAWAPLGGKTFARRPSAPFVEIASANRTSVQRLMLAWELALAPNIVPIVGSTKVDSVVDCMAAADVSLTAAELEALSEGAHAWS